MKHTQASNTNVFNFTLYGISNLEFANDKIAIIDAGVVEDFFHLVKSTAGNETADTLRAVANPIFDEATFTCSDPDFDCEKYRVANLTRLTQLQTLGKAVVGEETYKKFRDENKDRQVHILGNVSPSADDESAEPVVLSQTDKLKRIADDCINGITNSFHQNKHDTQYINYFISPLVTAIFKYKHAELILLANQFKRNCSKVIELAKHLECTRDEAKSLEKQGLGDEAIEVECDVNNAVFELDEAKADYLSVANELHDKINAL